MEENSVRRIQPHDKVAEQAVIGSMLMERDAIAEVSDIVTGSEFYISQYGILFDNIVELFNEGVPVDGITLSDKLKKKGVPDEISNLSYIGDFILNVPTSAHAAKYAKIVHEKAVLRKLIKTSEKIADDCYGAKDDVEDILDDAEKHIFEISQSQGGNNDFTSMNKIVVDVISQIEEASRLKGRLNGIPTGFIDLDNLLTGLHPDELILVAARPAMGKTAFVLNIAHHVAVHEEKPVVMFSLEMSKEQLVSRLIAVDSMVDAQSLKTGELNDEQWDKLIESSENMSRAPIFIDDNSGITIGELRSKCRKLKQKYDIGLIVIDYLQLMNPSRAVESRQQFISDMSRSLKNLARELKVPVIALSQLNRAVDSRPDHKPVLADLRESGAIEQDADVVMFIYRDDYYNKESEKPGVAEIIVAKQRGGSTGSVDLAWIGKYTKFSNFEKPAN